MRLVLTLLSLASAQNGFANTFSPAAPSWSQSGAFTQFPQSLPQASAGTFNSMPLTSSSSSFPSSGGSIDAAYASLYDGSKFRSYNMVISPSNLALMNQDPKKELKVSCDVTVDYQTPQAQTYSSPNLACGYKGSVGALRVCFDAQGKFSPDDCRKPSYKIDADYFNKNADDRIAGVKRLMFHGAPADWSMISERLAYSLLHQWGIIAPVATHASLYLNGQFNGVFVFVSAIDDIFSQKNFPNDYNQGKGGLYKEAWFNDVHIKEMSAAHRFGKNEDAFMNELYAAMLATPMDEQSAKQFFDKYFDVKSLIDVTAANTVLGNTDDWRQRHNMWWYIREDANGKKAVLIPWDYDRLNDPGADTRGALKGKPWWDPNTKQYCNTPLRTPAQRGNLKSPSDPVQAAYWKDIFEATPLDVEVPVSCDKIAQLMALALGSRIRQRTRELAGTINRASMQADVQTWTNQIAAAFARDPDGTNPTAMAAEQRSLIDRIVSASQKAVTDANNGDRGVSSSGVSSSITTSSSGTTFVPKAQATGAVASSSFSSFVPKAQATLAPVPAPSSKTTQSTSTFPSFAQNSFPTFNSFQSSSQASFSFPPVQPTSQLPSFQPQASSQLPSFQPQASSQLPSFQPQTSSQLPFQSSSFSSFQSQPSSSFSSFQPSQSSFASFQPMAQSSFASSQPSFPSFSSSFPASSSGSFSSSFQSAPLANAGFSASSWGR